MYVAYAPPGSFVLYFAVVLAKYRHACSRLSILRRTNDQTSHHGFMMYTYNVQLIALFDRRVSRFSEGISCTNPAGSAMAKFDFRSMMLFSFPAHELANMNSRPRAIVSTTTGPYLVNHVVSKDDRTWAAPLYPKKGSVVFCTNSNHGFESHTKSRMMFSKTTSTSRLLVSTTGTMIV